MSGDLSRRRGPSVLSAGTTATLIGYTRRSTDEQDLTTEREQDVGERLAHRVVRAVGRAAATFAEFEVDLLRMRTREGMAVAKAKGKQPKVSARQQAHLVAQRRSGEHTIADLAELFSVSRTTVYRVLERAQQTGKAVDQQP